MATVHDDAFNEPTDGAAGRKAMARAMTGEEEQNAESRCWPRLPRNTKQTKSKLGWADRGSKPDDGQI